MMLPRRRQQQRLAIAMIMTLQQLLSSSFYSSLSRRSLPAAFRGVVVSAFIPTTTSSSSLLSRGRGRALWSSTSSGEATSAAPTTTTAASAVTTSSSTLPEQVAYTYGMDDIVNVCKRRGLIFPSSEVYGGYAGFYDYGPLGVEMKRNVKALWWDRFVRQRDDVVGLVSSIVHNPAVWRASGHVDGFSDPMVDCKETKLRYRADQLFYSAVTVNGGRRQIGYVCVQESGDDDMVQEGMRQAKALLKELLQQPDSDLDKRTTKIDPLHFMDFTTADASTMAQIPSPASGKPTLTLPRDFNLMFQTNVGAVASDDETEADANVAYLRPETAQGIFINYKNVLSTCPRLKVPFGIAQIGKAFRNEITPRNFIFRSREFEQMEIEYFIPPGDDVWPTHHHEWIAASYDFLTNDVGLRPELLHYKIHDKLAHYATACTDITFDFPFGAESELMGIAARGNYDLTQHGQASGKSMEYYDEETKTKYVPHVIEPSLGVDRLILAIICSAYHKDVVGGEERSVLRFHPRIAPVKVSVLPLLKNKPALVEAATELYQMLLTRTDYAVTFDTSGAIGRRYRRADEIGIPFCITVDFETIEGGPDRTVTVRDRDTTQQVRLPMKDVLPYLARAIDGYDQ